MCVLIQENPKRPRIARSLPICWVEVDEVCGYDVDLDTPDQYAAEDALYLYEGPLPDDDESTPTSRLARGGVRHV